MHPWIRRIIIFAMALIAAFFISTWVAVWVAKFLGWAIGSIDDTVHSVFRGPTAQFAGGFPIFFISQETQK